MSRAACWFALILVAPPTTQPAPELFEPRVISTGEFDHGERLDEIVVGAQSEPCHPIAHRGGRGQHEHSRGGTGV